MQLTDGEKSRWLTATTPAERKAVLKEVRAREREARQEERVANEIADSLSRFFGIDVR